MGLLRVQLGPCEGAKPAEQSGELRSGEDVRALEQSELLTNSQLTEAVNKLAKD